MKREAFLMKLKDGCADEYRRRHDRIWPELVIKHSEYGIRNYTIFYEGKTNTLFAYRELINDNRVAQMPEDDLIRQWWAYNADLMECRADNSPVCLPLDDVFHME